jgi:hypothetical protein
MWRWWRDAGRVQRAIALLGIGGAACVALSLVPDPGFDAGWVRDVLMTVGSSLALFAPFYLLTRSLDRHLDRVAAETAQQVENVRSEAAAAKTELVDEVQALRDDVDRQLEEVVEQVKARLQAEAAADEAAFDALRTSGSREAFVAAFERAQRLGLVSAVHPPRVSISRHSRLYASVEFSANIFSGGTPLLRVETLNGSVQDWIEWNEDQSAEDVLFEVGIALRKHTGETFDPAAFLGGLADLLEAALRHPERRPAIELCPPQWMVCEWGVITTDSRAYPVALSSLQTSPTINSHVASKPWVDAESWDAAYDAACALFPARSNPWLDPDGNPAH